MARVLVTGGAGFIGRHLVRKLQVEGVDLIVVDNLKRAEKLDANLRQGDIRDFDFMHSVCRGVDTVFHLAAQSSVLGAVAEPEYSFTTNVGGTLTVLDAARRAGVRRFVFTSSREVYADVQSSPVPEHCCLEPKNLYGASKAAAEMYCGTFPDLELVTLRLANVYGPGDSGRVVPLFIDSALRGRPLKIFGVSKALDLVWIGDVVDALWAAANVPIIKATLNIGSGYSIGLHELAAYIIFLTGSTSTIIQERGRGVEVDRYCSDISRAKRLLGYQPKDQFLYGIDHVIESIEAELVR